MYTCICVYCFKLFLYSYTVYCPWSKFVYYPQICFVLYCCIYSHKSPYNNGRNKEHIDKHPPHNSDCLVISVYGYETNSLVNNVQYTGIYVCQMVSTLLVAAGKYFASARWSNQTVKCSNSVASSVLVSLYFALTLLCFLFSWEIICIYIWTIPKMPTYVIPTSFYIQLQHTTVWTQ